MECPKHPGTEYVVNANHDGHCPECLVALVTQHALDREASGEPGVRMYMDLYGQRVPIFLTAIERVED